MSQIRSVWDKDKNNSTWTEKITSKSGQDQVLKK